MVGEGASGFVFDKENKEAKTVSDRFRFVRSGDEPLHARSPLRLRLGLACLGLAYTTAAAVLVALWGPVWLVVVCVVVAVIAIVDIAIVVRHIRAGSRFQPGPEVPPYRPARRSATAARPHPAPRSSIRHRRYVLSVIAALIILVNAWTWIDAISVPASIALSVAAILLVLFGVITASVDSPIERGIPGAGDDRASTIETDREAIPDERESGKSSESEPRTHARRARSSRDLPESHPRRGRKRKLPHGTGR